MELRMVWIWPAVLALAACGGGGSDGGGSGIDPRLARLDIYEAQRVRILGDPGAGAMGMAQTDPGAMPTSGSADFTGFVSIRVESATPMTLFGGAGISVGFDTQEVTGRMDSFFGTNSTGSVVDYSGAIAIDGGSVGATAGNSLTLDYAGALTTTGETLVFDGTATGSFLGTPIGAISLSELEAVVDHNGQLRDATLVILAETSP